jgi:glycosyl hydrolase family 42 (putative beta-galactosidase)
MISTRTVGGRSVSRSRPPRLEALEPRLLLAGDSVLAIQGLNDLAAGGDLPALSQPVGQTSSAEGLSAIWIEGEDYTSSTFNNHSWYRSTDVNMDLLSPGLPGVSDGDWHVHYISSSGGPSEAIASYSFDVTEEGSYNWWIRLNPYRNYYSYSVDGGAWEDLLVTESANRMNLIEPGIDTRFLGWVLVDRDLGLDPGAHTVRVRIAADSGARGGIDAMAFTNFHWDPAGSIPPDLDPAEPGPDDWFMLAVGPDEFSEDSIIDMSHLVEAPAGQHGAVRRVGDAFEFADGTPVKFWGVGGTMAGSQEAMVQRARFWRKHGINMVRQHPVEGVLGVLQKDPVSGERYLDPEKLDTWDRWFATLRSEGIYMTWSLFYPHVITPDDGYDPALYAELPDRGEGKSTSGLVAFMQPLQDAEWEWERTLLEHVNPYTGLAYKDDPALAAVEVHNEDSIFFHSPLNDIRNDAFPEHCAIFRKMWQEWVKARYGTDVALEAAWGDGMRTGDSVDNENMYVYAAYHMNADGPSNPDEKARMGDYIRFLAEFQRGYYQRREQRLRALGFQGVTVTTAWKAGGPAADAANLWTDDAMDAIDRHNYFGGGEVNYKIVEGQVSNGSHLSMPGSGILGTSYFQVEDKPFIMTEWTQKPPNQWKAEIMPLFAFYGMGLQGWDASYKFTASTSYMGNGWPNLSTYTAATPHYMGQFPALAAAIYQGHVQEGDPAVARRLSEDDIFQGVDAFTQDIPGGGYDPGQPVGNLSYPSQAFAVGRVSAKIADGLQPSYACDMDQYVDWDDQVVQSNTGELTWDYGNRVVTVHSEKTQGVIGFAGGGSYDLPGVTVDVETGFVSLLLTPLDNRALVDSQHVLVTAMARDQQYGAEYSPDGSQLLSVGGPPLLLEPVKATLTFKGDALSSVKVVDVYGVPTERDVEREGNTFAIDGRYATYYYEVCRSSMPGDANADGAVTDADYTVWADHYGTSAGATVSTGDFNGDGAVTDADYTVWADHYGMVATQAASTGESQMPVVSSAATTLPQKPRSSGKLSQSRASLASIHSFLGWRQIRALSNRGRLGLTESEETDLLAILPPAVPG